MQNVKGIARYMLTIYTLAYVRADNGIDVLATPMAGKLESTMLPEPSESVVEVVIKEPERGDGIPSASSSQHQDTDQRPAETILKTNQSRHPLDSDRMVQNPNELRWGMGIHGRKDVTADQRQSASNRRYKSDARVTEVWPSHQHERCYVINTDMIPVSEVEKVIDQFENHPNSVRFVYKKNILGFAFCTSNSGIIDSIREKYTLVNVEEDKTFRIGSVENDARLRQSTRATDAGTFEGDLDFIGRGHSKSSTCVEGTVKIGTNGMIQSPVPTHLYRIMNMGNAFLNNYLLDNVIFRMLGISSLIRYFYSHEYFYTGRNVKVTIIDTPRCNEHRQINSSLITGFENSLAKNSSLRIVEAFSCDGTIKLSKLLDALEKMPRTDILVLPFSGPHSEALNLSLKRVALSTIIVAASGNDSENSCNHSPSGHHMIRVGSVDKHGYISAFSNRGSCTNLYSLGEDVLGRSGTSYSASLVASAAAVFIEKHPGTSYDMVLEHLMSNTMKNEYNCAILKIPRVDPRAETKMEHPYYTWKSVAVYNAVLVIAAVAILYGLLARYRASGADDRYIISSLR